MLLNEAVSVFFAELDFPEQDYFHRAPRGTLFATLSPKTVLVKNAVVAIIANYKGV